MMILDSSYFLGHCVGLLYRK